MPAPAAERPNVLMIVVDDLNTEITAMNPEAPIRTPHLERLAARGLLLTRAYCSSPACNPSRTSVLTGVRPADSGVYGNRSDWRRALPDTVTLMQRFKRAGYRVEGAGKIFHHHLGGLFHDQDSFHDFLLLSDPPDAPMPEKKLNGLDWYGSVNTDWGVWPSDPEMSVDIRTVNDAIARLEAHRSATEPLFLAVGIFRPHMPFFAPQEYFEQYPADQVRMPVVLENDTDDIPAGGQKLLRAKRWFWDGMMQAEANRPGTWREAVRAYQACATFADAQIGRLLDALDASGRAENTVILLWSDHGFHLGEKHHWEKFALWERTTHVPYIIVAPGVTTPGSRCDRPVDLMSVYPTLCELSGLDVDDHVDGDSLLPLLRNPDADWDRPAVMTYLRGNHAVRSSRWRYIRYADGTEELYDHTEDPHEWTNLAGREELAEVIAEHRRWLPEQNAPPAPDLKAPRKVDVEVDP